MLFIVLFEFSVGPILWLYMAEICQDKAIGLACSLNWLIGLIISFAIPPIIAAIKTPENDNVGYIFIFFGVVTACGLVFIYFFMYETKGKTQQEIQQTFSGANKKRRVLPPAEETTDLNNTKSMRSSVPSADNVTY